MADLNTCIVWSCVYIYTCIYIRFVLKTDDDAFVNMFSLMPHLHELASTDDVANSTSESSSMLLMCNVWRDALVERAPGDKWCIERSTWRYDYWPTFCQGIAFVMTMDFVTSAYQLVHRVPRLWLDDVMLSDRFIYLCRRNETKRTLR